MTYKLLEINISSGKVKEKFIEEKILKQYLGGRGLGVRLFFDYSKPTIEPLSSESPIFFTTGPLTGTKAPLSGRFHCVFKSPLTGTIFDSSCGGRTGLYLKRLGIDGIVILGKSKKPVLIYIDEEKIDLIAGDNLKGKTINERRNILEKNFGSNISYILPGPAAEKGVLYANLCSDRRFFGRGGAGLIFASKNLYGIVVKKTEKNIESAINIDKFEFTVKEIHKWLYGNPITSQGLPQFGTSVLMNLINELNILPYKNFQESHFQFADKISGEALKERVIKRRACFSCPVACGRTTSIGDGPEFETLWSLGAALGVSDLDAILEFNEICSQHGIDTISLGGTIACYLEVHKEPFGDSKTIKELILKTANNIDDGKDIALGSKRLSEKFGLKELSMTVKGLELPAYHPKALYGMALAYGTSNRGGCHLRAYMLAPEVLGIPKLVDRKIQKGKSGLVIYLQNSHAACDSAIFCRFLGIAVTDDYCSRLLEAHTGMEINTTEYQKIGERIYNLERIFNLLSGFRKKDDIIPERVSFDGYLNMLYEYYLARGWDEEGKPKERKLKELNLLELLG